jgi:hypothetical protein
MWAIDNRTPYKVDRAWGRDRDGVHEWIVAVKATYDIRADGSVALAEQQADVLLSPEYVGAPGRSSVRYDADVVGTKPATDVIVVGHAHAPEGRATSEFLIGLGVGPVRKVLRVRGDRKRGESSARPVLRVPLVYERAWGGYDDASPDPKERRIELRNPVGVGIDPRAVELPNFEYPDGSPSKTGPAGFGAIDSHWSPRLEWQGTYDETWKRERFPLPPRDWDPRSRQCAPPDQVADAPLRGGEAVELVNLSPTGRMTFALPRMSLRFSTHLDGQIEEHAGHLSTVILEPDDRRIMMVWQSTLAVRTNGDYLDQTVVSEKVRPW